MSPSNSMRKAGRTRPVRTCCARKGAFFSCALTYGRFLTVLTATASISEDPAPASKLVFFQYQGMRLLTKILWEGDKTGAELIRKGREEEVARRIAPAKVERAEASSRP